MTFRLSTLLLVTTLIGVMLGVLIANPLLGCGLLYLVVAAWIRTGNYVAECKSAELSLTATAFTHTFVSSIFRIALILIAAIASMTITIVVVCGTAIAVMNYVDPLCGGLLTVGGVIFALLAALGTGNRVADQLWTIRIPVAEGAQSENADRHGETVVR